MTGARPADATEMPDGAAGAVTRGRDIETGDARPGGYREPTRRFDRLDRATGGNPITTEAPARRRDEPHSARPAWDRWVSEWPCDR